MVLTLLFIFLTYMLGAVRISFLDHFTFLSENAHQICLDLLPKNPITQPALQALVCGHNFESLESSKLYLSSGLIHLFVVSGSHLIFVEKFLNSVFKILGVKKMTTLLLFILFAYCLVCQLNPPVIRSFLGLLLTALLTKNHKYWPRDFILLLTGLTCLALQPDWINSLGLQMSWLAALALHMNERFLSSKPKLQHQLIFYSLFIFSFSCLGFPELVTVITSLLFSPILEFVLLPLAFLTIPFPGVDSIFEKILTALHFILASCELNISGVLTHVEQTVFLNWFLILALQLVLHFRPVKT